MAYVSLYRKYRPQTFEDVVGQDHVTTTLQNAIRAGHVANGYLFCGTRGTAKTTCARILAKALNCIGPDGSGTSPTSAPCGECGPCKSIASSSFVDVLEMDAASHGKVDDVRDLVASIKFPPMEGRYKVYIIDEAHQLSRDAMDAFLKTLEEPPDRVVFVLATTELEKLPITIASRCQVFEFRRGSVGQIAGRLRTVLDAETVSMQDEAVAIVARAAEGSYRDALSILEQVLAFKRDALTASDVTNVLGTVDSDFLARTVRAIAGSDAVEAFRLAEDLFSNGREVRSFLKTLAHHFRDLLYISVGASPVDANEVNNAAALKEQVGMLPPAALLKAIDVLTAAERDIRWNNQHRILLETTLLRLIHLPEHAAAATIATLSKPANAAVNTQTPVAKAQSAAPSATNTASAIPAVRDTVPPTAVAAHPETVPPPVAAAREAAHQPAIAAVQETSQSPVAAIWDAATSDRDADSTERDVIPDTPEPDIPMDDEVSDPEEDFEEAPISIVPMQSNGLSPAGDEDLLQVQCVVAEQEAAPAVSPQLFADGEYATDLGRLQRSWQEVINRMENLQPSGVPIAKDARPVDLTDKTITLCFTSRFFVDKMENKRARAIFEEIINKTLGATPGTFTIKCTLATDQSNGGQKSPAPPASAAAAVPVEAKHSSLMDEAIAVFGGQIIEDSEVKG